MGIMRVLNKDILEAVQEVKDMLQLQQKEIQNIRKENKEQQIVLEGQIEEVVNRIEKFNSAQGVKISREITGVSKKITQVLEEIKLENKSNMDNVLVLKGMLQDVKEINAKYEEKVENELEQIVSKINQSKEENIREIEDGMEKVQKAIRANKRELKDIKDTVGEMEEGCILNLVNSLLDDIEV